MKGLIKKDLLLLKKETSPVIFVALLPPLFAGITNPSFFLIMLTAALSMLLGMQVFNTMSYDEKINWRKNVQAFPILPLKEAESKYCLAGFLAGINFGMIFAIGSITKALLPGITIKIVLLYAFIGMLIVVIYNLLVIPLGYYFGCEKVKYLLFLLVIVPFGIGMISSYWEINVYKILVSVPILYLLGVVFILLIGMLVVSLLITKKILENKH